MVSIASHPDSRYATPDDWLAEEATPFALDSPASLAAAADRLIASLDDRLELLGLGEALHGGEEFPIFRNRLFRYLVEAHGFGAIAIESSFPRGRLVDDHVAGRGAAAAGAVWDAGFSPGFGALDANRELVEWLRAYNADPAHPTKLRFYGFDAPTEGTYTESPRHLLDDALAFLAAVDPAAAGARRQRIEPLLGPDAAWENPAASLDPMQAVGLSPAAAALRIETEELVSELCVRRPELEAERDDDRYAEALHLATLARQLLTYHAALARPSATRMVELLGIRAAMMADNLAYVAASERGRGKVLVFAHNSHLQRGQVRWQLGSWWPAGAHLDRTFGPRYAAVGSAVGVSPANGIGRPEAGTLEARLTATPGPARLVPTAKGDALPASLIAALPTRSGSTANFSYSPLSPQSLTDFDWLLALDEATYQRGFPPLPDR